MLGIGQFCKSTVLTLGVTSDPCPSRKSLQPFSCFASFWPPPPNQGLVSITVDLPVVGFIPVERHRAYILVLAPLLTVLLRSTHRVVGESEAVAPPTEPGGLKAPPRGVTAFITCHFLSHRSSTPAYTFILGPVHEGHWESEAVSPPPGCWPAQGKAQKWAAGLGRPWAISLRVWTPSVPH